MKKESFIGRTLNRTFYYGFSSILGKIVGFLMLPIYTNYLTPADYGVAGFLVFYVSLAQILLGGKLEQAITKFHYDKDRDDPLASILTTATVFTVLFASIPLILSLVFSDKISLLLFDSVDYSLAVKIISFNILFGTLELYGLQYIKIIDKPLTYLCLNVAKLFIQLSINIVLIVFMDFGVLGVVVSSAAAAICITTICAILVLLNESNVKFDGKLLPNLFWFSAPLWLSGLLGLYSGSINQVFIKEFASLSDLGIYNLAATFGGLVGTLAWTPFFNFWSVERFRIYEQPNSKQIYQKVFYWSAGISCFLSFGISVFAKPVIQIMAEPAFHEAAKAVAPLTIFTTVQFLIWYLAFSFLVTDNNKVLASNGLLYAILITVIFFLTIPKWGFVGAAYGILIANLINLHIIEWRTRKYYDMKLSIIVIDVMVVITLLAIYLFNQTSHYFPQPLVAAGINAAIITGCLVVTLGVTYIVSPKLFEPILQRIKDR